MARSDDMQRGHVLTIRWRLACLVLACVLPVWAAAGFLVWYSYLYKRRLVEQHMVETAHALTLSLDRELDRIKASLKALATSRDLPGPDPAVQDPTEADLARFHEQTRAVLRDYPGADIVLADRTGQQLVNSFKTFGEPLPRRNNPDTVRRIFETAAPVVTNLFRGALTGRPLFGVDVPVVRDGAVALDLAMTVPANRLTSILAGQHLPPEMLGFVLDGAGFVVARTLNPEKFVGWRSRPELHQRILEATEGTVELDSFEGAPSTMAFSRSLDCGWTVVIGMPTAVLRADARQWLWWTLGGAGLLSVAGLGLAMVIGHGIALSIRKLVAPALALGRGESVSVEPMSLRETDAVGQALAKASRLLKTRAAERDRAERALAERTILVQRQVENLRALNNIEALSPVNPADELATALILGARHLGMSTGILGQTDGDRCIVRHHAASPEAGLSDGMVFVRDFACCSAMPAGDEVVAIRRLSASPRTGIGCRRSFPVESLISAPVTVRGQPYGSVSFSSPEPYDREFDEGDREFMRLFARWVGGVLERQVVMEELGRSNTELEQFAYVASHDLRAPLRQVASYLTLLERRLAGALDDDSRDFIAFARDGAKRMDRLILDLLDYSRIGRHERPLETVALGTVVDEALSNLALAIEEAGGRIVTAGRLPDVTGDRTELVRLFQNLIGNAVKYHAPDRPPLVTLSAGQEGERWVISVQDNGIGIAPEYRDRIFGIFQRLHGRDEYEGNGIGLAICRKIAENHHGRLWVDSIPGEGSTFFVALPGPSPEARSREERADLGMRHGMAPRISSPALNES